VRSVIIGFGKSGRALHLPAIVHARRLCRGEAMFTPGRPIAVDPRLFVKPRMRDDSTVLLVRSLDQVPDLDPARAVAHVCTPPLGRADTIEMLATAGFRHIICEKPVAASLDELHRIVAIAERHGVEIAVVSPWLSSALTLRLRELIDSAPLGALQRIEITQDKPRFVRTRDNADHPSAFEIEIPHSLSLVLHLAGPDATLVSASADDMTIDHLTLQGLGGAHLTLEHAGGVTTTVSSDLTAPWRRRSAQLTFERGRATAFYPIGPDPYCQLVLEPAGEPARPPELLVDDHLVRMMIDWYQYFSDLGPRPVSTLAFNVRVVELLAQAKATAGIERPGVLVEPAPIEVALP
jgi:predicted dehydrogenase